MGEYGPVVQPGEAIWKMPGNMGDRHFVYYGGADFRHDFHLCGKAQGVDTPGADYTCEQLNEALGLATLRADGFVSLDMVRMRNCIHFVSPTADRSLW